MSDRKSYCNYRAVHEVLDAHDALSNLGVGAAECLVLIAIARHTGQESDLCWLSYETIAEEALMSRASAYRAVKALKSAKVIEIKGRHSSGALRYMLTLDRINLTTPSQSDYGESINLRRSRSQSETARSQSEILRSQIDTRSNKEEIKEEVKEVVPRITSAGTGEAGGVKDGGKTPTSRHAPDGTAKAKTSPAATGGDDRNQAPVDLVPVAFGSAPQDRLARYLYDLLGCPKPFHVAAVSQWPASFRSLLDCSWSEDDITAAMSWATSSDPFWSTKIIAGPGVAEFICRNADKIIPRAQAADRAKRNAGATNTTTTTATNGPTPTRDAVGTSAGVAQWNDPAIRAARVAEFARLNAAAQKGATS